MYLLQPEPESSSASILYASDTGSQEEQNCRPLEPERVKIKANFLIARPVPKLSLQFSSKLVLQIQQLAQNHRPVPVLEIRQPLLFKSKFTRGFRQDIKLRSGDLFAHLTECYITSAPVDRDVSNVENQSMNDNNITAAMCFNEMASNIFFRDARCSWQGSVMKTAEPQKSRTCYRFTINDEEKDAARPIRIVMHWEKKNEVAESSDILKEEMFTLFFIDRGARRKNKIATMTKNGLEINVRKVFVLESLQACFDLMDYTDCEKGDPSHAFETRLYTLTLTLGMWVGFQESWFN
ncbi:hypothetical protein N7540_009817 [Penicillium herquei]|nr:hypothetical protein N7540_009817 [Penicillium herquei]